VPTSALIDQHHPGRDVLARDDLAPDADFNGLRLDQVKQGVEEYAAVDAVRPGTRGKVAKPRSDQGASGCVSGVEFFEWCRVGQHPVADAEVPEDFLPRTLE
jgi:hypothetical protein